MLVVSEDSGSYRYYIHLQRANARAGRLHLHPQKRCNHISSSELSTVFGKEDKQITLFLSQI